MKKTFLVLALGLLFQANAFAKLEEIRLRFENDPTREDVFKSVSILELRSDYRSERIYIMATQADGKQCQFELVNQLTDPRGDVGQLLNVYKLLVDPSFSYYLRFHPSKASGSYCQYAFDTYTTSYTLGLMR